MNLHNAEFVRSVTSVADCPKDGLPQIAFAGKSNVGKSSVINKLLLRKNFARVGEAPGKTTHINFFRIDEAMYLVDLPGYGYAKVPQKEKERWGRLMEAYFAAPATLTFGVMLVAQCRSPHPKRAASPASGSEEACMNLHNAEFVRSVTSVADCPKDGLPQIAFAGKSNVGKSSVINKLLLRKNFARVGEAPGKTTHINFFRIDEAMYLVDLPGYGYAKVPQKEKERWGRLMEAYFAAPATLTFGVMLVDARHAPTANDVVMANYFLQSGKPFVVVANKLDKLKKSEIEPNLARIREVLSLPDDVRLIPFSAEKGDGRDELLTVILHAAEQ